MPLQASGRTAVLFFVDVIPTEARIPAAVGVSVSVLDGAVGAVPLSTGSEDLAEVRR